MINPDRIPDVSPDEGLARYVMHSSHIRRSNQTIKADAFMPHPHRQLSVIRHLAATESELWFFGEQVAAVTGKTLHGRGDIHAAVCLAHLLPVDAAPTETNPNHATVSGWPLDKPAQKIIALEMAAAAVFVANK